MKGRDIDPPDPETVRKDRIAFVESGIRTLRLALPEDLVAFDEAVSNLRRTALCLASLTTELEELKK